MQMPITGKVLPSSFLLLRFPLSLWLLQPSFELTLVTTARTTNRRTSTRPKSLRRTSLMTQGPPRPAYLLFTSPRPAEESHQRLDCTGLSATVVDSGPSSRSRSHTRTRVLEPARSDSARIERPAHPQGQRYSEHRGRCRGWCRHPEVGIRPARVGLPL